MNLKHNLKSRLRSGAATLGSWITLGHPAIGEIAARAGFDWTVVDLEHSTIDIKEAGELIRTIDLCGGAPLVRLTSIDPDLIKRVMDAGAHGIVAPMVNSARDAELAVAAVRYAPAGFRGVGLARAQEYGPGFADYLAWQATESIVIVQIEHRDAIEQLDAILAVDGVDGFIIGPYDLSCSLGIPGQFDRPEFQDAMQRILAAGARSTKPAGIHIVEPDLQALRTRLAEGYRFIAYSVDIRVLDAVFRSGVAGFKEIVG